MTRQPHSTQDAIPGVGQAEQNADQWWSDCAQRAIRDLASSGREFTAYDVQLLGVPEPDHPNRWGAAFRAACMRGVIRSAGFVRSSRPSREGGVCRLWVGAGGAS